MASPLLVLAAIALASPAPSPSPPPAHGVTWTATGFSTYVDTAANGPGLVPPEAPGFVTGSPLSPMTPYDTWSSAPLTPGEAAAAQLNFLARYAGSKYDASALFGAGLAAGSMQNAMYWSENMIPPLNSHLGYMRYSLPYKISFPTHAGQDDSAAATVALLSESFGAHDGSWLIRGGFFDLNQTNRFVFIQPPLTNVTPAIGIVTPESLGDGSSSLDSWPSAPPGLPLGGIDVTAHHGIASFEFSDAILPALAGTSVHAAIGSIVIDHGGGTRYSAQVVHAFSGGDPIATTTMYGADAQTNPGPQGPLPTSTLGGQRETIAGVAATFHLSRVLNATAEIGRTWYDADNVLRPGTVAPGGFYHLAIAASRGASTYDLEAYRFEGRYANMILPYGTPENVWSVAWSWPGVWLKSTYQLVDNLQYPGSNRQGYRAKYAGALHRLEIRTSYAQFWEIVPATLDNVTRSGFVDGFFLPQLDGAGTIGSQQQLALWLRWHMAAGDLTLDYVNDIMHRANAAGHPEDFVSYQAPQMILAFTRRFGTAAVADAGFGRYAMNGSFAQTYTNVNFFQNVYFAGVQFADGAHGAMLVQLRRSAFAGVPSILNGPSPNFRATTLVVEQRLY